MLQELTGASSVFDISQTPLDKRAAFDAILQFDRGLSEVAVTTFITQVLEGGGIMGFLKQFFFYT